MRTILLSAGGQTGLIIIITIPNFKSLIQNGDLSFVMASDESGMTQEDILLSLKERDIFNGRADTLRACRIR